MSILKSTAIFGSFTMISRILGFIRDILMAAVLGAGAITDCFVVAFKLPNFFRRLFAEGAFSASYVPIFSATLEKDGKEEALKFAEEAFACLLITLLLFVALFELFTPALIFSIANGFVDDEAKFSLAVILTRYTFPFILFVSTEPVGRRGYMNWDQIREVESEEFAFIGHHSHTHNYLIDETNDQFILDIEKANEIFIKELGYIPSLFSYPFGEYSKFMRDYISKNFEFAFGQHSGVIDINKDKFELPRFPINENYGDLHRFKSLINSYPIEYKKLLSLEKMIIKKNNHPEFVVELFKDE